MSKIFSIGGMALCKEVENSTGLTLNKIYKVSWVEPAGIFVSVIDDVGRSSKYSTKRFKPFSIFDAVEIACGI